MAHAVPQLSWPTPSPRDDGSTTPLAARGQALFREVDKNGDGVVDFNEFKVVMGVLGQQTGKTYNFLQ
eukprot:6946827-Prymnesium_polylepis.1